jgi:hypothetical protein
MIFFVTPTNRRPTQKADLIRLHQTLSYVPNLYWVLIEDAETASSAIDEILSRTRLKSVHLIAKTPAEKKLAENEPNWMLPRGVIQRNTALGWIRLEFLKENNTALWFFNVKSTKCFSARIFELLNMGFRFKVEKENIFS